VKVETIYDGSWGAVNLDRIHSLPTPKNTELIYDGSWGPQTLGQDSRPPNPPKKKTKKRHKEKEGWQKNT